MTDCVTDCVVTVTCHSDQELMVERAARNVVIAMHSRFGKAFDPQSGNMLAVFKELDADGSGLITRAEFDQWVYQTGACKVRSGYHRG
eukprot:7229530-Pyramimonas_sp.AAC.1